MSAGVDQLEVGDAVAEVVRAIGRAGAGQRVERHPDGPVADGMHVDLEAGAIERDRQSVERGLVPDRRAGIAAAAEVRRQQRGGAGLDDAVLEQLGRRGMDVRGGVAAAPARSRAIRVSPPAPGDFEGGHHAHGEACRPDRPRTSARSWPSSVRAENIVVMPNRSARLSARARPSAYSASVIGGRAWSARSAADSRSVPLGSPPASPARSGRSEGRGVSRVIPASASARELAQAEWPSAAHSKAGRSGTSRSSSAFDGLPAGNSGSCQPAPRTHGSLGMRGRPGANAGRDGVEVAALVEVAQAEVDAALDRVHVGVLEAGQQHPARQVDHLGAAPDQAGGQAVGADVDDAPVAHAHRRRPAPRGVDRIDCAVPEHEIRGGRNLAPGGSRASGRRQAARARRQGGGEASRDMIAPPRRPRQGRRTYGSTVMAISIESRIDPGDEARKPTTRRRVPSRPAAS